MRTSIRRGWVIASVVLTAERTALAEGDHLAPIREIAEEGPPRPVLKEPWPTALTKLCDSPDVPCVLLDLDGPEGLQLLGTRRGETESVTVCHGPCQVWVPREPLATYVVRAERQTSMLRVEGASGERIRIRVAIQPEDKSMLIGGVMIGSMGTVAALVGLAGMGISDLPQGEHDTSADKDQRWATGRTWALVGVGMIAVGVVVAVLGAASKPLTVTFGGGRR